jgi:hypothetical protein
MLIRTVMTQLNLSTPESLSNIGQCSNKLDLPPSYRNKSAGEVSSGDLVAA